MIGVQDCVRPRYKYSDPPSPFISQDTLFPRSLHAHLVCPQLPTISKRMFNYFLMQYQIVADSIEEETKQVNKLDYN